MKKPKKAKPQTKPRIGRPPLTPEQRQEQREQNAAFERERMSRLRDIARAAARKHLPQPKRNPGDPERPGTEFEPTPHQRAQVEMMSGLGLREDEIALLVINPDTGMPIDRKTLSKHFALELQTGPASLNMDVANSLYRKGIGNGPQSVAAAIFYLKCRAGWRERVTVEVESKAGVLIAPAGSNPEDWIRQAAAANAARVEPGSGGANGNGNGNGGHAAGNGNGHGTPNGEPKAGGAEGPKKRGP